MSVNPTMYAEALNEWYKLDRQYKELQGSNGLGPNDEPLIWNLSDEKREEFASLGRRVDEAWERVKEAQR
ncbi:MAG TPA: hypothetical protein VFA32_02345 [Dehalococcoidia bacterium]|jgi:hypothetical protein|nr:hypothetical protein [Dehalococcoidia bacterium]